MDFNKIKAMGLEYAEKGKNAAMDLAEKGKTQALLVVEITQTVENELDMLKAVAALKENECNAAVVFLGNFGLEIPETLTPLISLDAFFMIILSIRNLLK